MAYIIEQKIGKNIYVYEAASHWDREKQQPRQIRNYLGKKDVQTGTITKLRGSFKPRYSKDWGNIYLLSEIAKRIGIVEVLKESYPEIWKHLLYLAMYEVCEGKPLYLFKIWAEQTYIEEDVQLSSQRISEFLKELGTRENQRQNFYKIWIDRQKDLRSVIFDIPSLSSWSNFIEILEWGYNRDKESLPQINFGIVFGEPSCLPLFFTIYPGSIKDVTTLKNIIIQSNRFGINNSLFVLDKGFYSKNNIQQMKKEKIKFLIPLPFSTEISNLLIHKHQSSLSNPLNSFRIGKKVFFYSKDKIEIAGMKLITHLYMDEKRKAQETEQFLNTIIELEEKVKEKEFKKTIEIKEYLEDTFKGWSKFFNFSIQKGKPGIFRKQKPLFEIIEHIGKTILISNKFSLDGKDALWLYRKKDFVESLFDTLKNEIKDKRLRIHSSEALEGRLFLSFLSLILHSAVTKIMREKNIFKDYSLTELLYELKKIKIVEMENGKIYLTEVSKKQRELLQKFDLSVPFMIT